MFKISSDPIDRNQELAKLANSRAGGLVVFEGWVRDHNEGKSVGSLEYQVYAELAIKEGEKILGEARKRFHIEDAFCVHREGHLQIGDTAVLIAAIASHRAAAFEASRFIIDQIKLRLPIWKKEHYKSDEAQWVYCKDHATHVHFSEEDFYLKQTKLVEQSKLKNAHVMVVGAGGLGCPALTGLTAAGVGNITIVDHDVIEHSNLHRQPLYSPGVVGEKKALVAQKRLLELNPYIKIHAVTDFVHEQNARELIQGQSLVLDCTDNMKTKFAIHDACFSMGIPLISAAVHRYQGQLRTFIPKENLGCARCTLKAAPDDSLLGNCNDFGVVAPTLGVLGSLQASEALFYLQNEDSASAHSTLFLDLKSLELQKVRHYKNPDCDFCQGDFSSPSSDLEISGSEIQSNFELLDIRELGDSEIEPALAKLLNGSERKIAVFCHRGIRSFSFVKKMREKGVDQVYSVRGGAATLSGEAQAESPSI